MNVTLGSPDSAGAGRRLLLAEDDPDLLEMLTDLLTAEGYAVDVARDGTTALHRALNEQHQVAVFDRGLPHMDGLTLLRRLRSAGWSAPVLVLSALGTLQDRDAGSAAGAQDYLVKPFDIDQLLARLEALLCRLPATPYAACPTTSPTRARPAEHM